MTMVLIFFAVLLAGGVQVVPLALTEQQTLQPLILQHIMKTSELRKFGIKDRFNPQILPSNNTGTEHPLETPIQEQSTPSSVSETEPHLDQDNFATTDTITSASVNNDNGNPVPVEENENNKDLTKTQTEEDASANGQAPPGNKRHRGSRVQNLTTVNHSINLVDSGKNSNPNIEQTVVMEGGKDGGPKSDHNILSQISSSLSGGDTAANKENYRIEVPDADADADADAEQAELLMLNGLKTNSNNRASEGAKKLAKHENPKTDTEEIINILINAEQDDLYSTEDGSHVRTGGNTVLCNESVTISNCTLFANDSYDIGLNVIVKTKLNNSLTKGNSATKSEEPSYTVGRDGAPFKIVAENSTQDEETLKSVLIKLLVANNHKSEKLSKELKKLLSTLKSKDMNEISSICELTGSCESDSSEKILNTLTTEDKISLLQVIKKQQINSDKPVTGKSDLRVVKIDSDDTGDGSGESSSNRLAKISKHKKSNRHSSEESDGEPQSEPTTGRRGSHTGSKSQQSLKFGVWHQKIRNPGEKEKDVASPIGNSNWKEKESKEDLSGKYGGKDSFEAGTAGRAVEETNFYVNMERYQPQQL